MTGRRSPYERVLQDASSEHRTNSLPETEEFSDTKLLLTPDTLRSDWEHTSYEPNNSSKSNATPPSYLSNQPSPILPIQDDSHCNAKTGYRKHHGTWSTISILLLATYSTLLSGVWVGLALSGPYYAFVGTAGGMSPTVASTIIAAFAKSIELAFVTIFVAFLGQFLSRKALSAHSTGITLADMQLRSFLLQPGLIVQSWHSFHYTARTLLGVFAMVAALVSLLYTTASDALGSNGLRVSGTKADRGAVSPKPNLRHPEIRHVDGTVWTDFANNTYVMSQCPTPIGPDIDPEFAGSTCSAIEHSGQAFHNYMQYLSTWTNFPQPKQKRDDSFTGRPAPIGMLFENTTAQGSWLFTDQVPLLRKLGGRNINNVTMAMPHSGVYSVAMDTLKRRPELNSGEDTDSQLRMTAQVVSPAINVLCADVTAKELEPLIYDEWPAHRGQLSPSTYANYTDSIVPDWRNKTAVDDLFGFSEKRTPPVFPKLPIIYNTVLNYTHVWGSDAIYLLTAANITNNTQYNMCEISMSTEQGCSTDLTIDVTGGKIKTICGDKLPLAFTSEAPSGVKSVNWPGVGADWGSALSLGAGISDGAAANARLLSQLVPANDTADDSKPTIAEALAVMAGCTLLVGSPGAPFNQDWITNPNAMPKDLAINPQTQSFKAEVQTSGYNSGANMAWQKAFNVVLISVFLISCWCLGYFCHIIRIDGLVNDFMEYQNMFALALHSPADRRLAGTAASGPEKQQLRERWYIKEDYNHEVFIGDGKRRRGHTSWMSHAPSTSSLPVPMQDMAFENMESKPPKTFEPTMRDGIRRTLGGLGIRSDKQKRDST